MLSSKLKDHPRIGELLVQNGCITQEQLDEALTIQSRNPHKSGLIGHLLVELGYVKYSTLLQIVSEFQHIPMAETVMADRKKLKEKYAAFSSDTTEAPEEKEDAPDLPHDPALRASTIKALYEPPIPSIKDLEEIPVENADEHQVAMMGRSLLETEDWNEAEAFLEDALSQFPSSAQLNWQMAWMYLRTARETKALQLMKNLPALTTRHACLHSLEAYIYEVNDLHTEAINIYQKLITNERPHPDWYFLLGYSLLIVEAMTNAKKVFKHFLKITPNLENEMTHFARKQVQEIGDDE